MCAVIVAGAMAAQHALRPAGGAAGIGHAERIVLVDAYLRDRVRLAGQKLSKGRFAALRRSNHDPLLQLWEAIEHARDLLREGILMDQHLRVGLVENISELVRRVENGDGDQDGVLLRATPKKMGPLFRPIARQHRNLRALF